GRGLRAREVRHPAGRGIRDGAGGRELPAPQRAEGSAQVEPARPALSPISPDNRIVATRSQLEPPQAGETAPAPRAGAGPAARRALRIGLLLLGLAVFAFLVRSVGWPAIASNLARIGGWFPALVVLYGLAQLAFAAGWWVIFDDAERPRPSFGRLFAVYLAGDAFNYLAPGGVAGEPLKARMLRGTASTREAVASLTIHKHADLLAQWIFVTVGVAVALWKFPMSLPARLLALAGAGGLGVLLLL